MIYFAIGDIHGEADKLRRLHVRIVERIVALQGPDACIVHLGDYINRGPDSRGAIETIMSLETRLAGLVRVLSLKGNHDDRAAAWSPEKAASRGLEARHLDWLRTRPTQHFDSARGLAFVHAGIDPSTFPNCSDYTRTRTRSATFMEGLGWPPGLTVVHGHTFEGRAPTVRRHRINVDTGACFGGPLTAVELREGVAPKFIRAD